MRSSQVTRCALLAVAVLASLLASAAPAAAYGFVARYRSDPLPGVEVTGLGDPGAPLSIDVGRVAKGAAVHVEVVRAGDAVAGDSSRLETPSAACRRVGGIICVNGDFSECPGCGAPLGGVVHDGVLERSALSGHGQLQLGPNRIAAGPLSLGATLVARATHPGPDGTDQVKEATLTLDAVNRTRGPDQVVLFTPRWAGATATDAVGDEATFGGGAAQLSADVPIVPRLLRLGTGSTPIPSDGMVVSASGAAAARLRAFWAVADDPSATGRTVVLQPRADQVVEESVGGHPLVLAGGVSVIDGSNDPFATGRNPRTLVGWNTSGDLWLVTVDGRQPGVSQGVSLSEGAGVLRQLGATDGFNLDGGGSSTFVSLTPGGGRTPVVLNRPSDGFERRMETFLAVIPNDPAAVRCGGGPAARSASRAAPASTRAAQAADSPGYRMAAADGGIFTFGDAGFFGTVETSCMNGGIVGMAPTPSGSGYWLAGSDGGVFALGDAGFFGSTAGAPLRRSVVGMAATPTGDGYWLVASDGGIFAFGDARFLGSTGGVALQRPVVGMAATPSGNGYWLVASDGGIFTFGDAAFLGSTGRVALQRPVVGMAATPSGGGYWLVASDGGIFTFGDSGFFGSTGALALQRPVVGMAGASAGRGYWLVASDGGIFTFGAAPFLGSTGGVRLNRPIVAMSATA